MKKQTTLKTLGIVFAMATVATGAILISNSYLDASSHREAPLISNDPQADNTDVYAFRSPDDTSTVTIIANYSPGEVPQDGPNYHQFGEDVRYEIHIKNNPATQGDDIIYRFRFEQTNEDPTTFFNIRLGQQNLKETYTCKKSIDGGNTWQTIVSNGIVPPNNVGPRSIQSSTGLAAQSYASLRNGAITTATTGETIFCGPSDDPFFVDIGAIFDLGNTRQDSTGEKRAKDGLSCKNIRSLCIQVPIAMLQKDGKDVTQAVNILDPDFIIGVYATASRQLITVRSYQGDKPFNIGDWVQISRLGMPLTNEVIIPIGKKDYWNSQDPYNEDTIFEKYFTNPELGLYMDDSQFGTAVPNLQDLRIQTNSLQAYDFRNFADGLSGLLGNPATIGTAFDVALFGNYLLRPGQPRSVDLLPIFHTGVPNLPPYQLATGKNGNPLAQGKPFINNFLPTFGDMLRLNMAVPVTQRNDPAFSTMGLLNAAVLGLTDPLYNTTTTLQFIPNMDGFPNGRRLEDDVTRIELQAVGGAVLAAIGLWYDDYTAGSLNPVTPDLLSVLGYTTGVEKNDMPLRNVFPYLAHPRSGYSSACTRFGELSANRMYPGMDASLKLSSPELFMSAYPNPAVSQTTIKYRVKDKAMLSLRILDQEGKIIEAPIIDKTLEIGTYELNYNVTKLQNGVYFATLYNDDDMVQYIRFVVSK